MGDVVDTTALEQVGDVVVDGLERGVGELRTATLPNGGDDVVGIPAARHISTRFHHVYCEDQKRATRRAAKCSTGFGSRSSLISASRRSSNSLRQLRRVEYHRGRTAVVLVPGCRRSRRRPAAAPGVAPLAGPRLYGPSRLLVTGRWSDRSSRGYTRRAFSSNTRRLSSSVSSNASRYRFVSSQ